MTTPRIYIPTFRRVNAQATADALKGTEWFDNTFLVVGEEEAVPLERRGYQVLTTPQEGHIGRKRQWIFDQHSDELWGHKLFMLDDDLRFFKRLQDNPQKFVRLEDKGEVSEMFWKLAEGLDQVPMTTILTRFMAHTKPTPVVMNDQIGQVMCFNMNVIRKHDIRFDRVVYMEDCDIYLQLLNLGYDVAVYSVYCKNSTPNTDGGCSVHRNHDTQREAAEYLAKLWPGIVTTVTRNGWRGSMAGETRTDIKAYRHKAAKQGKEGRELLGLEQEPTPDWSGLFPDWC